jgi:hypothetical protein
MTKLVVAFYNSANGPETDVLQKEHKITFLEREKTISAGTFATIKRSLFFSLSLPLKLSLSLSVSTSFSYAPYPSKLLCKSVTIISPHKTTALILNKFVLPIKYEFITLTPSKNKYKSKVYHTTGHDGPERK